MKARIKATGEIAEFSTDKNSQGETILLKVGTASIFSLNEVEPIADIDWQHYRIQAAIAAMQAALTNYEYYAEGIKTECKNSNTTRPKVVAFMARELADALVAELKKGGQE